MSDILKTDEFILMLYRLAEQLAKPPFLVRRTRRKVGVPANRRRNNPSLAGFDVMSDPGVSSTQVGGVESCKLPRIYSSPTANALTRHS